MLILHKNISCDPSVEPSQQDGSDEGSQHITSTSNKKNYHETPPVSRALNDKG